MKKSVISSISLLLLTTPLIPSGCVSNRIEGHARYFHTESADPDHAAFLRAAKFGNTACLSKLLAAGLDVNMRDKKGYSPLMHAVLSEQHASDRAINFLLEQGADPTINAYDGSMPLHNAFMLGRLDVATQLFHSIITTKKITPAGCKPSMSFLIADLKLSENNAVTILEMGQGTLSYFKGFDSLYKKGLIWQRFWEYLATKNLPIWYVGNMSTSSREGDEISFATLKAHGGVLCPSLHVLEKDARFKKVIARVRNASTTKDSLNNQSQAITPVIPASEPGSRAIEVQDPGSEAGMTDNKKSPAITSPTSAGIIVLRHHNTNQAMLNYFKTTYPEVMILDEATKPFVNSKFMTNLLFANDEQLSHFRPQCTTYKKGCTAELIKTIQTDFAAYERLVIKPIDASNGWGVIITKQHHLTRELATIFSDDKTFLKKSLDSSYNYWLSDPNKQFLVEAFAASKTVAVYKKKYDATMRQVFVIENGTTGITTTFLGSYWKLPALGINDAGTETERHKSNMKASSKPSAMVDAQDDAVVQEAIRFIAPRIYTKMLLCG